MSVSTPTRGTPEPYSVEVGSGFRVRGLLVHSTSNMAAETETAPIPAIVEPSGIVELVNATATEVPIVNVPVPTMVSVST